MAPPTALQQLWAAEGEERTTTPSVRRRARNNHTPSLWDAEGGEGGEGEDGGEGRTDRARLTREPLESVVVARTLGGGVGDGEKVLASTGSSERQSNGPPS